MSPEYFIFSKNAYLGILITVPAPRLSFLSRNIIVLPRSDEPIKREWLPLEPMATKLKFVPAIV